ncbi:MAG: PepSY domain-containing protein [Pseudomonadales bacterium]
MAVPEHQSRAAGRRRRRLYRWHRRAGVSAAAFLLFLAATGVPLQYSAELQLERRYVTVGAILDHYGLQAPNLALGSAGLVAVDDQIFYQHRPVAQLAGFSGALRYQGLVLAAGSEQVLLLDPDAAAPVLDQFRFTGGLGRLGSIEGLPVLETGTGVLMADAELANWRPLTRAPATEPEWAVAEALSAAAAAPYLTAYRERMLPLQRCLQDLHSGRFFGPLGVLFVNLASAALVFLAASGLILWWRQHNR